MELSFEARDMVYLMLQPYRQSTFKKSGVENDTIDPFGSLGVWVKWLMG